MSVQLDIESQFLESEESREGSISSPRTRRWRLISLIVRTGLAFASKTTNKSDDEQPLLSSPRTRRWRLICLIVRMGRVFASKIAAKPDGEPTFLRGPRTRRWRLIFLTVRAGRAFASKTSTKPDDEQPFLSSQGSRNGDVELINISDSIQVYSQYESNQASDNCNRDREQQYARLAMIVKQKDLDSLNQSGGVKGFAEALGVDLEKGLLSNAENGLPCQPVILSPHSETGPSHNEFISLIKSTCNNYTLFLILLCAILLLILGIKEEGWETGWCQGILIILSTLVCITASLTLKYWFLWCGSKMSISNNKEVYLDVLRGGQRCKISISKVVLGDIVCLNEGSKVPADGLFVRGESLRLYEESQSTVNDQNPFLFAGANVIHGKGNMIVTSVCEEMSEVTCPPIKKTSLQLQIDQLNTWTQIVALIITNFLVLVTLLRFTFDKENGHPESPDLKKKPADMTDFMVGVQKIITNSSRLRILTTFLTMILLGFAEGMPFIVTLAIGYWNKKAITDKAITQDFMACLTAGSVTAICTDILAWPTISLVELDVYIGQELINDLSKVDPCVCEALRDGIGTLLLGLPRPMSLMEHSLLTWAPVKLGLEISKEEYRILDKKELVSNEVSGVLMGKVVGQDTFHSHWNGPATNILSMCSRYYDSAGTINAINGRDRKDLEEHIKNVQVKYLKSIAFGYKQVNTQTVEDSNLVLIGWLCLKHPFQRPMKALTDAGVAIKMVSKCGVEELKSIALQWGLDIPNLDLDHTVILGDQFRRYTHEQRIEKVDQICIMGHSLPSDKLLMVKCLKEKAHTVVMVGVTSDDLQSNLESDVGITMGECSTKSVKDGSKIVISQGDFSTLFTIVMFGRCARENIQNFIRIELTMTIAWLLINIITTSCFGDSPMTGVQFFWICLIESFFGGLGLLAVSPNDVIMKKSPERGTVSLLTRTMWRSIIAEALYQTAVLVTFQYKWSVVPGISRKVVKTMIFNSFVICQVFNWFNARYIKEKNVLLEINRNCWFWVAICVTLVSQETYIEMAHIFANNARLNFLQWAMCFLIGGASCVIDWFNKCISDLVEHCWITVSTRTSWSPSFRSISSLGLPLMDDVQQ